MGERERVSVLVAFAMGEDWEIDFRGNKGRQLLELDEEFAA